MRENRQLKLLDALREREHAGEPFDLSSLVEVTGYKLSTLKTYYTKRLRDTILFEDAAGRLRVRGTLQMSEEAFLRRLDQRRAGSELSHDAGHFASLTSRSSEHFGLALSLYHRPSSACRVENFCHHMSQAWSLLLLAAVGSIDAAEVEALTKGLLGDPLEHGLGRAFGEEEAGIKANIRMVLELSKVPAAVPLTVLLGELSRLFQASVLNYLGLWERVCEAPLPSAGLVGVLSSASRPDDEETKSAHGAANFGALTEVLRRFEAQVALTPSAGFSIAPGVGWVMRPLTESVQEKGEVSLSVSSEFKDQTQASLFSQAAVVASGSSGAPELEEVSEEGPQPETVAQFLELALLSLPEKDRALLERRVVEGAAVEVLEREEGLTKHRLKARLSGIVLGLRQDLCGHAQRLTRPIMAAMAESGGLIHRAEVVETIGDGDLRQVAFVLAVAGEVSVRRWRDEFLTTIPAREFSRRLDQLGDELRSQSSARLGLIRVMAMANEITGVSLPQEAFARLVDIAFDMRSDEDDKLVLSKARTENTLALLEAEARPMHSLELAQAYGHAHPEDVRGDVEEGDAPERQLAENLLEILTTQEDVYSVGRDTFVHRSALPVPHGRLKKLVSWCVEHTEGLAGTISPQRLLGELDRTGKDRKGLSAALLYDCLKRHSDIVTFKYTPLVAHVDNYKDKGLTLEELLERILEESAESMTLPQILDKLPESVVFHRKSVRALLLTGPWAISLGPGRYEHIDGTGLALEERSRLLDDVIERLPGEGEPVLCRDLLEPQAGAAPDPQASRSLAILWGLLHKDERVQCGPALMVALSGTPGAQRLLRQAVMEVIREHEVIHIRQLRLEITARYGHSGMEGVLRALLRECVDEGLVTRGPERVYALPKVER